MLKFPTTATAFLLAGLLVPLDGVLSLPTGSADAVIARDPTIPTICPTGSLEDCGFENPTMYPWSSSSHFGGATFSLVNDAKLANSGSNSVVFTGGGQAALRSPSLYVSSGEHQVTCYTRLAAGQPCVLGLSYADQPFGQGYISPVSYTYSATTIPFNVQRVGSLEFTITCFGDSTIYFDDISVV